MFAVSASRTNAGIQNRGTSRPQPVKVQEPAKPPKQKFTVAKSQKRKMDGEESLRSIIYAQQEEISALRDVIQRMAERQTEIEAAVDMEPEEIFAFRPKVKVKDIIQMVSKEHEVSVRDMMGPTRRKHIVAARHDAMARVHQMRPDMSLPHIGKCFNGRDHTTVLSALKKMGVYQTRSRIE